MKKTKLKGPVTMPRPEVNLPEVTPEVDSPLGLYLKLNGVTEAAFARAMGGVHTSVKTWADGSSVPSLVAAYEIERVTKGAVPMEAWLGMARAKEGLKSFRLKQPAEVRKMPSVLEGGGFSSKKRTKAESEAHRIAREIDEAVEDHEP